jgi:hypothetical protein
MLFFGLVRPGAGSSGVAEDEPSGTRDCIVVPINAKIKLITDPDVLMGKVSILSWTVRTRLGRLWNHKQ